MKIITKLLIMSILINFLTACFLAKKENYAAAAPVKKISCELSFPTDLIYQSTPDASVILGKKQIEPAIFEVSGFEVSSGKKLWQLPFQGAIVGNTEKQILVYEEKTSTVHFINPKDGQITRKISPAPNPLTSKNGLESGMAFTDDMYLTTKGLYTSIWENRRQDETFPIGVTAKSWESNEKKWFLPPVKQIVIIEYRPIIFGDKVLIINTRQKIGGPHSYQNISLKTGEELFRGNSEGEFSYIGKDFFMDQTSAFVRRIDPLTNKDIWKIEADFTNASVSSVSAGQITVSTPHPDHTRTIRIVDAESGKVLKQFDLPDLQRTGFNAAYLTKDNKIWLNFSLELNKNADKDHYNYWASYNPETKKAEWRTDFNSESVSSLFPFVSEKMKVEN
jgi:hypothetical protein